MKKSLLMLLMTGALAATTLPSRAAPVPSGHLAFSGQVEAASCVISGNESVTDMGMLLASNIPSGTGTSFYSKDIPTTITGCPTALTKVIFTPTYDQTGDAGYETLFNEGDATGVDLGLLGNPDASSGHFVSAVPVEFPLVNGNVTIPLKIVALRNKETLKQGTLAYSATFTFDYQ